MSTIAYYFLMGLSWVYQLIPLRIHFLFSDILYFIIYHIIGYRKKVVRENLTNAFPGKGDKELKQIERKFYHHLCDSFIETFYFIHISQKEINKRVVWDNLEAVKQNYRDGRHVIFSLGHYNNWEWLVNMPLFVPHKFYVIYKPLHNKAFDRFMKRLRNRFGAIPLEKAKVFRQLMADKRDGVLTITGFLNDQTPKENEIQYWTNFLNQDTPILMGTEKISKKLDAVIYGVHMKKVKRGYYKASITLLCDAPKETKPFEITETHTRWLEGVILEEPAYWLWSHRRWKHVRKHEE